MVDFLIVGPYNAITYNEVFPLFKDDVISLGVSKRGMSFINSDVDINSCWFTNFYHPGPGLLTLKKSGEYKKFDNYDAINIDRVEDIVDYDDVMGVPITFMDRYDRRQFRIVGVLKNGCWWDDEGLQGSNGVQMTLVDGVCKYLRILIRRRKDG